MKKLNSFFFSRAMKKFQIPESDDINTQSDEISNPVLVSKAISK